MLQSELGAALEAMRSRDSEREREAFRLLQKHSAVQRAVLATEEQLHAACSVLEAVEAVLRSTVSTSRGSVFATVEASGNWFRAAIHRVVEMIDRQRQSSSSSSSMVMTSSSCAESPMAAGVAVAGVVSDGGGGGRWSSAPSQSAAERFHSGLHSGIAYTDDDYDSTVNVNRNGNGNGEVSAAVSGGTRDGRARVRARQSPRNDPTGTLGLGLLAAPRLGAGVGVAAVPSETETDACAVSDAVSIQFASSSAPVSAAFQHHAEAPRGAYASELDRCVCVFVY